MSPVTINQAVRRDFVSCQPGDQNTSSRPTGNVGPVRFSRDLALVSRATNLASTVRLDSLEHPRDRYQSCSGALSSCLLISNHSREDAAVEQTPGGSRLQQLSGAVAREFAGCLPSWIIARIEAKVLRKQAEEDAIPARPRLIKGKWREK